MWLVGLIFGLGFVSLILISIYSEFKDSYDYDDTWGIIKYGGILIIIITVILIGIFSWYSKYSIKSEFKLFLPTYINMTPNQYANSNLGYSPKIVIVDKDNYEIHKYHFSLPENQMAKKPSEVDIVVWIEYGETFYDYYGTKKNPTKTKGYIGHYKITLIDSKSKYLISKRKFSGTGKDNFTYRTRRGSGAPKKKVFSPSREKIMSFILNRY